MRTLQNSLTIAFLVLSIFISGKDPGSRLIVLEIDQAFETKNLEPLSPEPGTQNLQTQYPAPGFS